MKFLVFAVTFFVQAAQAQAATNCESAARLAAQGMVSATAQSLKMDLKLEEAPALRSLSETSPFRFTVRGPQTSYVLEVQTNASCVPTSVKWPYLD